MKLIHVSDLHLGKRIYDVSLLEEQRYMLEQILKLCQERKTDGVLLAGDLYDKTVPSAEAVSLFDWFLTSLVKLGQEVYMVSGNHDSAERISYGNELFCQSGVYVSKLFDGTLQKIQKEDEFGTVNVYLMPFLRPGQIREAYGLKEIGTYTEAFSFLLEQLDINWDERNILVGHQNVIGAMEGGSEESFIGGVDSISPSVFSKFDYVALGHIHRMQSIGKETIRYSGSPYKYSFHEVHQEKGVLYLELQEKGNLTVETIQLVPKRDLREIEGPYEKLVSDEVVRQGNPNDYINVILTDREPILDALYGLRAVYPNLLHFEYAKSKDTVQELELSVKEMEKLSPAQQFAAFWNNMTTEEMSEEKKSYAQTVGIEIFGEEWGTME